MGVLKELWTGRLLEQFRHDGRWLERIAGEDDKVNNNVIHLVDLGADPEVLVNNTAYPIAVVSQDDEDVAISLDKFDTKNTKVTDDELYAISYDKIDAVQKKHKEALIEKTLEKAHHSMAPLANGASSPVLQTTGEDDGTGRLRLVPKDLIRMKRKFDDLKIPKKDRIVILSNEHVEDLLMVDESFEKQYKDNRDGKILRLHGWDIYEEVYNPVYNGDTGQKAAFGAAAAGTDRNASVFLYTGRAFKCRGTNKIYLRRAEEDPENRMTVMGYRQYFIALPMKWDAFGAIYSAQAGV